MKKLSEHSEDSKIHSTADQAEIYRQTYMKDPHKHGTNAFPLAVYKVVDTPKRLTEGSMYTSLPPHYHEEFEIFYVRQGNCTYHINGDSYELSSGTLMLVCPKMMHWAYITNCEENTVTIATAFHPRFLSGFVDDIVSARYLSGIFNSDHNIYPLMSHDIDWQREIIDKYLEIVSFFDETGCDDNDPLHRDEILSLRDDAVCPEIKIKSLLFDIFYTYIKNTTIPSDERTISKSAHTYLLKSIEYIHDHYNEKLTLSDVAQCAFMSNEYYTRVFMKYMGCQPFSYINSYRINRSIGLLANTDMKIIDIALSCGFLNVSYFNRRFRDLMKCTPTEYRRMIGGK